MRQIATVLFLALLATLPQLVQAEEITAPAKVENAPEKKGGYLDWMRSELEMIGEMDLYGVTSQLPKGYLSFKWDWGTIRAKNRYNDQRQLGPVMEPISFTDEQGNEIVNIDMGLNGYGGGHTFQWSYGITDPLDWYFELPFTYMNVSFDPTISSIKDKDGNLIKDEDGNELKVAPQKAALLGIKDPVNFNACDFMYETLDLLGRPPVANNFKGKWMLGDINTGFSWNIYRTPRFSVALTPRVFLPTGHRAPANNNILWGTGPELETGIGGWAVGFTQGYDLRIFKYSYWIDIIASTEFTAAYAFPQKRKYPTNFPEDGMGAALDANSFPDLSHLEGTFTYTPGWSMDWTAQLQVQIAILGLGVAYGIQHMQEPELIGDRSFLLMARSLELLGQQTLHAVQLAASLSLLPIYIPLDISFQWRKVVDGFNAIVFDDYYQVTVKGYIPLKLLWER